jgi:hypothetical protein
MTTLEKSDESNDWTVTSAIERRKAEDSNDKLLRLLAIHHDEHRTIPTPPDEYFVRVIHQPGFVPSASSLNII